LWLWLLYDANPKGDVDAHFNRYSDWNLHHDLRRYTKRYCNGHLNNGRFGLWLRLCYNCHGLRHGHGHGNIHQDFGWYTNGYTDGYAKRDLHHVRLGLCLRL
jgi:hypothetical protein